VFANSANLSKPAVLSQEQYAPKVNICWVKPTFGANQTHVQENLAVFYVMAINRETINAIFFGPYETRAVAGAAVNAGRRRGGKVSWHVGPLHAPAQGGDPHGAFVVCVGDADGEFVVQISGYRHVLMMDASGLQLTGPFSTSAAARAWRRKNKIDAVHGFVTTLRLKIDEVTVKVLWLPQGLMRRAWV
jgi:hypothetical protein